MINYNRRPKSFGVSYNPWHSQLLKLLKEKETPLNIENNELYDLYHVDCSPEEVYYINRIRTVKSAILHLSWFDEFGQEKVQFSNNEEIRHFYKLNPDVKKVMETKGSRN